MIKKASKSKICTVVQRLETQEEPVLKLAIQDSQDPQQQEVGTLDLQLENGGRPPAPQWPAQGPVTSLYWRW